MTVFAGNIMDCVTAAIGKSLLFADNNTRAHLSLNSKYKAPKNKCTYGPNGQAGCGAMICNSCYNFYRPLHSKSRQHASGIRRRDDLYRHRRP